VQAQTPTAQEMRERLEKSLVLGPTAIEQMGVRHLWQQRLTMTDGATALRGWMRGDSAFVLDSRGGLSRLSLKDGSVIWRSEVIGPQDRVLGIHRARLDGRDRIFAVIDSEFIQLDGTTGALINRKPSKEYLSADCAVAWPYLIFASASGRVVWFHALLGVNHHQGLVNGAIRGTPQVIGNEIVAAGTSGEVAGFIKEDARMLWRRNIGPVFGRPEWHDTLEVLHREPDHRRPHALRRLTAGAGAVGRPRLPGDRLQGQHGRRASLGRRGPRNDRRRDRPEHRGRRWRGPNHARA
jgi:hypothetical protein